MGGRAPGAPPRSANELGCQANGGRAPGTPPLDPPMYRVENVSTASTYIALYALEILMSSIDSINIYSIDGVVEKLSVSAFQNFLQIENWLNFKKVMDRNMWMCFVSTVST